MGEENKNKPNLKRMTMQTNQMKFGQIFIHGLSSYDKRNHKALVFKREREMKTSELDGFPIAVDR